MKKANQKKNNNGRFNFRLNQRNLKDQEITQCFLLKGDFDNNEFIMNGILIILIIFMIYDLNFCEFDLILEKKY